MECPHGQDLNIHCPPCDDSPASHRLPRWRLTRRKAARFPARCGNGECRQPIAAGMYAAFWTDDARDDGGLVVTCGTCHPAGDPDIPLEVSRDAARSLLCPRCGSRLVAPVRTEYRRGRMKPARRQPTPWCTACGYRHTDAPREMPDKEGSGA